MHYNDLYTTGQITIEELRQHQANEMPRCVNHLGRPAYGITADGPMCEECGCAWIRSHRLYIVSQRVVRGGMGYETE